MKCFSLRLCWLHLTLSDKIGLFTKFKIGCFLQLDTFFWKINASGVVLSDKIPPLHAVTPLYSSLSFRMFCQKPYQKFLSLGHTSFAYAFTYAKLIFMLLQTHGISLTRIENIPVSTWPPKNKSCHITSEPWQFYPLPPLGLFQKNHCSKNSATTSLTDTSLVTIVSLDLVQFAVFGDNAS